MSSTDLLSGAATQFTRFWDLPGEIRALIYCELLTMPSRRMILHAKRYWTGTSRHTYPTLRQKPDPSVSEPLEIWLDQPWEDVADPARVEPSRVHVLRYPSPLQDVSREKDYPKHHIDSLQSRRHSYRDERASFLLASRRLYDEAIIEYHRLVHLTCHLPEHLADLMWRTHACGTAALVSSLAVSFCLVIDEILWGATNESYDQYWDADDWSAFLDALRPDALAKAFPRLRSLTVRFLPSYDGDRVDDDGMYRKEFETFISEHFAPKFSGLSDVAVTVEGLRHVGLERWIENGVRGSWEPAEAYKSDSWGVHPDE